VLNDGATTGRRADDIREIVRECDLAAALTRQLLTFGRPHTSRPQPTDFNNMIETIERMAQRLIGEDVECRIVLDPAAEYIMADRTQVEQVLINLIVNARDAMPRGGTLTLETADVVVDERSAAAHGGGVTPGRYVMLHVRDTGTGMDQSTMDRMFAPFFTTKHSGTGLGLATVYDIVKQHGGFIEAESLLGVGTTFTLYFPVVAFSKSVAAEETSTPAAGAEPSVVAQSARVSASTHTAVQGTAEKTATPETQTVLVVEDDRVVRHLVRNTLRGQGYHVLYAADGTEALEIAKSYAGKIDLLFTDIVMPRMHGLDLATALAELRPSLRVIYTSGYALETVVPETPPEMDFLPKPYMPSTLLQRIRETLEMA
jgi:CheY-like chemotaxis protein